MPLLVRGGVVLQFGSYFRGGLTNATGDVDVTTNGGASWTNVLRLQGDDGPSIKNIDLTAALSPNPANAQIRFRYQAPVAGGENRPESEALALWAEYQDPKVLCCGQMTISPFNIQNPTLGVPYSQSFTQTGGTGTITWRACCNLPPGLMFDPATATLSGTPTQSGTFNFFLSATSSNGCSVGISFTMTVENPVPAISSLSPPNRLAGSTAFMLTVNGNNFVPTSVVRWNNQDRQTTYVSPTQLTAAIPASDLVAAGSASVTVFNPAPVGGASNAHTFIICPLISVNPPTIPNGTVGAAYPNITFTQTGGTAPITWSIIGDLPPGLAFTPATATLSGTPSQVGTFSFTVRATDANGCFGERPYTVIIGGNGLVFYPLTRPIRLFDTRAPIPGFPACEYLSQRLTGGAELIKQARITCDGITIPADARAIVGNATVILPSGGGYLTMWPEGQIRPPVSNLNYVAGQIVANAFTVSLGNTGLFKVFSVANTDFALDIMGYFAPPKPEGLYFHPLPRPIRLFDTRPPIPGFPACEYLSQRLTGSEELVKQARVTCDGITIPDDAQVIVGNSTIILPSGGGYLTLWPEGQVRPPVSNLNYVAADIRANAFTVGLGATGQFKIFSVAGTDLAMDVTGYFSLSAIDFNGMGLFYSPLTSPIRLFDTRAPIPGFPACEYLNQRLTGGEELVKQARITCDGQTIPAGAQAITGNATAILPTGGGYLTMWPEGQPRPPVSNLNYRAGDIIPNAFTLRLGGTGLFKIYSVATSDFVLDVSGFYSP